MLVGKIALHRFGAQLRQQLVVVRFVLRITKADDLQNEAVAVGDLYSDLIQLRLSIRCQLGAAWFEEDHRRVSDAVLVETGAQFVNVALNPGDARVGLFSRRRGAVGGLLRFIGATTNVIDARSQFADRLRVAA